MTQFDQPVSHAKTLIPTEWARWLAHISVDTGQTKQALLREAVALLLRHHGYDISGPLLPGTRAVPQEGQVTR